MRWMVVAAVVLSASACSDDPTGPDPIQIEGTYTLQTVNTQPLPIKVGDVGGGAFTIWQVGGTVRLNANRTYREEFAIESRFTDPQTGPVVEKDTTSFTGVWESQDSVVTVTVQKRIRNGVEEPFTDVLFGFVSENRLTLSFEEGNSLFTYVYRRN